MKKEQFLVDEYSKKIVEYFREMNIQEANLNGCGGF